jgi:hypothetical protein
MIIDLCCLQFRRRFCKHVITGCQQQCAVILNGAQLYCHCLYQRRDVLEQAGPLEALGQCCGLAAAAAASGADQSGAAVAQNMSFIGVMDELQQEGGAGEVHHAELLSSTGHRSNCVDGNRIDSRQ